MLVLVCWSSGISVYWGGRCLSTYESAECCDYGAWFERHFE